jgi:hypothetical protein
MEQAIAGDRARSALYGPALAWAAFCCVRLEADGRSEDPAADRLKRADFARRALEVRDDPVILANAALVLTYVGEDIDAMIALVDRALVLNPNFARGWHISPRSGCSRASPISLSSMSVSRCVSVPRPQWCVPFYNRRGGVVRLTSIEHK